MFLKQLYAFSPRYQNMIIYAETTTDFTRTYTEIQTTPFIIPGPNETIGEYKS